MNASNQPAGLSERPLSRRRFLAASGLVSAGVMVLPRHVLGGPGQVSPNSKLNIAGVGIGGQGGADIQEFSGENIVALCDVDWDYAG